jgi:hypothetical protein
MDNYIVLEILPSKTIEPRKFIRYCFGINKLLPQEILEEETNFGYCSKCVMLLSKILGLRKKTIREWGYNPNFEGMPQHARITCTYAQIGLSKEALDRIVCSDSKAPTVTATQFIEEILLKGLSPSERLKVISSTKFRGQCFALLSKTLKVSKSTIYEWGRDIELKSMPKHYEHTLAYALEAYKKRQTIAKRNAA